MQTPRIFMLSAVIWLGLALPGCNAPSEDAQPEEANNRSEDVDVGPSADEPDSGGGLLDFLGIEDTYEVPEGTMLTFELGEALSTETNESGDVFTATLGAPIVVEDRTLIPAGAEASGRVTEVEESGRVSGRASIRLVIDRVSHDGETYQIATDAFQAVAEPTRGEDVATIGAGAAIGAAIGGVLGGGEGAASGAAIGGGVGTAAVLTTRGDDIEIPSGTAIAFILSEPFEVSL